MLIRVGSCLSSGGSLLVKLLLFGVRFRYWVRGRVRYSSRFVV